MAAIEAIRPIASFFFGRGRTNSAESWVVPAFGLLLLLISAPRFAASLYAVPGDYVVWLIGKGVTVERGKLEVLWKSRELAARLVDSERYWSQMALAGAAMGNQAGWSAEGSASLLERTRRAQEKGLSLNPVNPYSWLRLAYMAEAAGGDGGEAAAALVMSYKTGPFIDELAEQRLRLSAKLWDDLGEDIHGRALAEAKYLWRRNPSYLAKMAAGNKVLSELVQKAARNLE